MSGGSHFERVASHRPSAREVISLDIAGLIGARFVSGRAMTCTFRGRVISLRESIWTRECRGVVDGVGLCRMFTGRCLPCIGSHLPGQVTCARRIARFLNISWCFDLDGLGLRLAGGSFLASGL
jgi:hypothetical protein